MLQMWKVNECLPMCFPNLPAILLRFLAYAAADTGQPTGLVSDCHKLGVQRCAYRLAVVGSTVYEVSFKLTWRMY